jgi:uncharacterized protein
MSSPAVMFEFMAIDQQRLIAFYQQVFGWKVEIQDGFGYIHFPEPVATLGGIGQAKTGIPGWEKHATFYVRVESLEHALAAVNANGGATFVEPTHAGKYRFAMFQDPEFNVIGIIEPFSE